MQSLDRAWVHGRGRHEVFGEGQDQRGPDRPGMAYDLNKAGVMLFGIPGRGERWQQSGAISIWVERKIKACRGGAWSKRGRLHLGAAAWEGRGNGGV